MYPSAKKKKNYMNGHRTILFFFLLSDCKSHSQSQEVRIEGTLVFHFLFNSTTLRNSQSYTSNIFDLLYMGRVCGMYSKYYEASIKQTSNLPTSLLLFPKFLLLLFPLNFCCRFAELHFSVALAFL